MQTDRSRHCPDLAGSFAAAPLYIANRARRTNSVSPSEASSECARGRGVSGTTAFGKTPVLDVRTYKLAPGAAPAFDRILREESLPMLARHGIRVVASGRSAEDSDTYYLIRLFASALEREEQLAAFYGSDEWRDNYRQRVLDLIASYHVAVVELTPAVRSALARPLLHPHNADGLEGTTTRATR